MFTSHEEMIRLASEILKMNPTLRYFLSLTLKLPGISSMHPTRNDANAATASLSER